MPYRTRYVGRHRRIQCPPYYDSNSLISLHYQEFNQHKPTLGPTFMMHLLAAIALATMDTVLYCAAQLALWTVVVSVVVAVAWLWKRATLPRESPGTIDTPGPADDDRPTAL